MMDATKTFDAYEVIGVITPGAVVTLLMALQWPDFRTFLGQEGLSVGGLGIFVIMAFVLGHLTQALGNFIDGVVWLLPGLPTTWVRSPKQSLISSNQREQLQAKITAMEPAITDISQVDRRCWLNISGRMYGRVHAAGRSGRIDACNRTYGLSRGLAAAFVGAAAWFAFEAGGISSEMGISIALAVLACARMWRSGVHYGRSLLVAYIDLP